MTFHHLLFQILDGCKYSIPSHRTDSSIMLKTRNPKHEKLPIVIGSSGFGTSRLFGSWKKKGWNFHQNGWCVCRRRRYVSGIIRSWTEARTGTHRTVHSLSLLFSFSFFEKEVHSHRKCMSISMVFEIGSFIRLRPFTFAKRRLQCHNATLLKNIPWNFLPVPP